MKKQLLALQEYLAQNGLDDAYISNPSDIHYFTGFYSDPVARILALLVFPDKDPFMFAPQLEVEAAKDAGWDKDVFGYLDHENPFALMAGHIKDVAGSPAKWGIEKDDLPVQKFEVIKQQFPSAEFPTNLSRYMENAKLIKTAEEINRYPWFYLTLKKQLKEEKKKGRNLNESN